MTDSLVVVLDDAIAGTVTRVARGRLRFDYDDDYRHRMVVNAFGLVFCILLALAGVWLANAIADMKQVQECVLAGRSGCVPLKLPPHAG